MARGQARNPASEQNSDGGLPERELGALESGVIGTPPAAARGPAIAATSAGAADDEADGVADSIDLCLKTPGGVVVDDTGCTINEAITLEGVNFYYDSHKLTRRARAVLDHVADVLGKQRNIKLEIAGHTDSQGDPAYNQWLSEQRAGAVKDYLVSRGLDAERFTTNGYGDQQPLTDNSTRPGLRANRRVELRRTP